MFNPIKIRPGVNLEATPLLNEAGWSVTSLIRFFGGLLQKLGGWQKLCSTALIGTCRALLPWADLNLNTYVAAGTEQRLQVLYSGSLYDITPIRRTVNLTNCLSTTNASTTVKITDTGHSATTGDWVNFADYVYIGGIVLYGLYFITVIDTNNYTITAASAATSTVNLSGTLPQFSTTVTSTLVTVTLVNHGFTVGQIFTVGVSTIVGGITLFGQYLVNTVTDSSHFTIIATSSATASTSGFENGGALRLQYLIASGQASSSISGGWGVGAWSFGAWNVGASSTALTPLRQWSLGAWGYFLMASPTNLPIYKWDPTGGLISNPATQITQAPANNTGIFIAMPQRQIVSYGATDAGTGLQDPMLVRWCDVDDFTSWTATATNQAGSYRLPRGSRIVSGIQAPQFGVLWTDLAIWQMQYIQPPLVYGFNEIASGCGLIGKNAAGILAGNLYWLSLKAPFQYNGSSVTAIPCPVWDFIYQNLYLVNQDKICCATNSLFGEVAWHFPSATGTGENDSYIKFKPSENVWDYGNLTRTAWVDQSIIGAPCGVDENNLIQQHETANDADGAALVATATTGWFKLAEGSLYIFLERLIPDFKVIGSATVQITVYVADYPTDTPIQYGPYNVTSATEFLVIRARGRLAKIQVSSTDVGTFWRLGELLHNGINAGRR